MAFSSPEKLVKKDIVKLVRVTTVAQL